MDDFEFYGDQPGDYDFYGNYGDPSQLFDYDFSDLFSSFGGNLDFDFSGFDVSDLIGGFDLEDTPFNFDYDLQDAPFEFDLEDSPFNTDFISEFNLPEVVTRAERIPGGEELPGFDNQTAGEFGVADIYDLKEKGFSDSAIKQIVGDYFTESAIDEALANYGSGLSAEETASFLDELDTTREGIEYQKYNDLQMMVTDVKRLFENTGGNIASVQQNLIASGVDPLMAADMANMAAMGMSESEIYDQIKEYYGDDAKYGEAFKKEDKPFWDGAPAGNNGTAPGGGGGGGGGGGSSTINKIANSLVPNPDKKSPIPAILGGLLGALTSPKVGGARGYQGGSKGLTASRAALSPAGAPGSGGKRFISQTRYAADGGLMQLQPNQSVTFMSAGGLPSKKSYENYLASLSSDEANNYDRLISRGMSPNQAVEALSQIPEGKSLAKGGISSLGSYSDGGRMLRGPGDGMSDSIPATIGGKRPARLADGEFVVPADVVSHLGNGSTDAGADVLYEMMSRIRKARTGNSKQGKQINPKKYVPK